MPRAQDTLVREERGQASLGCAAMAVTAGWLGLAMLAVNPALAEGRKSPRPFPKYSVEVIYGMPCPPIGFEPINGFAVASDGTVGGQLLHCNQTDRAFLYPVGGPLFVMPLPPAPRPGEYYAAYGNDSNDLHWLVGRISQSGGGIAEQGFVYRPDGTMDIIPPPPQGNWCEAMGVNAAGRAVGFWYNNVSGPFQAYRWEKGIRTDLTELPGPNSEAHGVSSSGLITGWTGNSTHVDARAFVWNEAEVTLLPPIPGGITSQGYEINDHGDVCGRGRVFVDALATYKWRAFAYIDGQMIAIPPLPGWTDHTGALSINSSGQVVGGSGYGFLWQDNIIVPLHELLVAPEPNLSIKGGRAINDEGWIVADGTTTGPGQSYAVTVLLIPIAVDPADLSGDGLVNGLDLALLLAQWGQCREECSGDIDDNGVVNGFDLAMLLASWSQQRKDKR